MIKPANIIEHEVKLRKVIYTNKIGDILTISPPSGNYSVLINSIKKSSIEHAIIN